MCYTRITHTTNGKAAIAYARGCRCGHNGHKQHNLLIGSVGMLPDEIEAFETQMEQDWIKRASSKNKNQIRRIVASFSPQELDAQNEDCAFIALEIAQEFVREAYPDRKACIFVQNDGIGNKLHVHVLVSNVDSLEYKGCRHRIQNRNLGRVSAGSGEVSGRESNADGKEAICYGRFAIEKDAGGRRKEEGNEARL